MVKKKKKKAGPSDSSVKGFQNILSQGESVPCSTLPLHTALTASEDVSCDHKKLLPSLSSPWDWMTGTEYLTIFGSPKLGTVSGTHQAFNDCLLNAWPEVQICSQATKSKQKQNGKKESIHLWIIPWIQKVLWIHKYGKRIQFRHNTLEEIPCKEKISCSYLLASIHTDTCMPTYLSIA